MAWTRSKSFIRPTHCFNHAELESGIGFTHKKQDAGIAETIHDATFVHPERRAQIANLEQGQGVRRAEVATHGGRETISADEGIWLAREVEYLRNLIADQDDLDGLVQLSMGTYDQQIQPGGSATITTRPQRAPIRLRRLFIAEPCAMSFRIVDVKIGNVSQLLSSDPLPATMFCRGIGQAVSGGVVNTAQDIVMEVVNIGSKPMDFLATWTVLVADDCAAPAIRRRSPIGSAGTPVWHGIIPMPSPGPGGPPRGELSTDEMAQIVDAIRAAKAPAAAAPLGDLTAEDMEKLVTSMRMAAAMAAAPAPSPSEPPSADSLLGAWYEIIGKSPPIILGDAAPAWTTPRVGTPSEPSTDEVTIGEPISPSHPQYASVRENAYRASRISISDDEPVGSNPPSPVPDTEVEPPAGSRRPAVPTGDKLIGWDPYGDD